MVSVGVEGRKDNFLRWLPKLAKQIYCQLLFCTTTELSCLTAVKSHGKACLRCSAVVGVLEWMIGIEAIDI